jgi:hypothetical protein
MGDRVVCREARASRAGRSVKDGLREGCPHICGERAEMPALRRDGLRSTGARRRCRQAGRCTGRPWECNISGANISGARARRDLQEMSGRRSRARRVLSRHRRATRARATRHRLREESFRRSCGSARVRRRRRRSNTGGVVVGGLVGFESDVGAGHRRFTARRSTPRDVHHRLTTDRPIGAFRQVRRFERARVLTQRPAGWRVSAESPRSSAPL